MNKNIKAYLLIVLAVTIVVLSGSLYVVNQTEQAIVLQFGEPVRLVKDAGGHQLSAQPKLRGSAPCAERYSVFRAQRALVLLQRHGQSGNGEYRYGLRAHQSCGVFGAQQPGVSSVSAEPAVWRHLVYQYGKQLRTPIQQLQQFLYEPSVYADSVQLLLQTLLTLTHVRVTCHPGFRQGRYPGSWH